MTNESTRDVSKRGLDFLLNLETQDRKKYKLISIKKL